MGKIRINITIDDTLKDRIEEYTAKKGTTMSSLINTLLTTYLEQELDYATEIREIKQRLDVIEITLKLKKIK